MAKSAEPMDEGTGWRWWCCECRRDTDYAPCEHCGAPHDSVLVLEPGQRPPATEDEFATTQSVEYYDWPEECYG